MVAQDPPAAIAKDRAVSVADRSASPVQQAHRRVCDARHSRRQHPSGGSYRSRSLTVHSRRHADRSRYQSGGSSVSPHLRTRSVVTCVVITVAAGLLFLGLSDVFGWNANPELVWFGLFLISFGGAVWLNANTFDSLRASQGAAAEVLRTEAASTGVLTAPSTPRAQGATV